MNPHVRPLVGWLVDRSVGWSVGWSVCLLKFPTKKAESEHYRSIYLPYNITEKIVKGILLRILSVRIYVRMSV